MTTETMNVHQALSELKLLAEKIDKTINATTFVVAAKQSVKSISGVPVQEMRDSISSNYQKIRDLIARRNAIKKAVVSSNATTHITVCGEEMTVAEAIDMKNNGMVHLLGLRDKITADYNAAQYVISQHEGDNLEKKAETYIMNVIAAQPKDAKMSADDATMKSLRDAYIKNNTFALINPIGVAGVIDELQNQAEKFLYSVDAALSTSNAQTMIQIEY